MGTFYISSIYISLTYICQFTSCNHFLHFSSCQAVFFLKANDDYPQIMVSSNHVVSSTVSWLHSNDDYPQIMVSSYRVVPSTVHDSTPMMIIHKLWLVLILLFHLLFHDSTPMMIIHKLWLVLIVLFHLPFHDSKAPLFVALILKFWQSTKMFFFLLDKMKLARKLTKYESWQKFCHCHTWRNVNHPNVITDEM